MVQILQWFSNEGFDFWLARSLLALKNQHQMSPFFFNATLKTSFLGIFIRMDPSERAAGKKNAISFLFHCVSKDFFLKNSD